MVLDPQGFVIKHQVFQGNHPEGPSLLEMVQSLAEGAKRPLVAIDSGMADRENLEKLKLAGCDYITVKKRPTRLAYKEEFASLDSLLKLQNRESKPEVLIKVLDEADERLVSCWSRERAEKEQRILSKAEIRFLTDLEKLKTRILKGRLKDPAKIQFTMGRLQECHSRVAKYYEMTFTDNPLEFSWQRNEVKYQQASDVDGGYILRTNLNEMDAEEIWNIYISLTCVEAGFKALKGHHGLWPIFHQTKDRCQGHIFITVLAYHLLLWIEHRLREQGDYRSWPTIQRLLRTHCYTAIQFQTSDGKRVHLRKAGESDTEQKKVYAMLNISYTDLPKSIAVASFPSRDKCVDFVAPLEQEFRINTPLVVPRAKLGLVVVAKLGIGDELQFLKQSMDRDRSTPKGSTFWCSSA